MHAFLLSYTHPKTLLRSFIEWEIAHYNSAAFPESTAQWYGVYL